MVRFTGLMLRLLEKKTKNVLEVKKNNRHLYLNEERKDAGWLYAANCLAFL